MTSAACDIDYSVERFFATRWTTTEIAYPRQPFDSEAPGLLRWIAFETLLVSGRPSRAADYQADVLITVNCFSRDGKRDLMRLAQQVEELLRGQAAALYDESSQTTLRGYLKLTDPATKALREQGGLLAVTVDVDGYLFLGG